MPLGDLKPQVSGVISKMLGQRTYKAQPEDEGLTQTMPGTFSREEFGQTYFDPSSARYSPIPVSHIMTPRQRGGVTAPGPGDIGGGEPGSSPAQPGQPPTQPGAPPNPTGPGPAPGTGGVPITAPSSGAPREGGGGDRGGNQGGGDWGGSHGEDPRGGAPSRGMARGGIVTRPTRALIGERGPEAVIPLNGDPRAALRASNELARAAMKRGDWKTALSALRRVSAGDSKGTKAPPWDELYPAPPDRPAPGQNGDEPGDPYWRTSPRRKREV